MSKKYRWWHRLFNAFPPCGTCRHLEGFPEYPIELCKCALVKDDKVILERHLRADGEPVRTTTTDYGTTRYCSHIRYPLMWLHVRMRWCRYEPDLVTRNDLTIDELDSMLDKIACDLLCQQYCNEACRAECSRTKRNGDFCESVLRDLHE